MVDGNPRFPRFCQPAEAIGVGNRVVLTGAGGQKSENPVNQP